MTDKRIPACLLRHGDRLRLYGARTETVAYLNWQEMRVYFMSGAYTSFCEGHVFLLA